VPGRAVLHIAAAYNTPINGFHRFMRDRAAVEQFRGVIETFVEPGRRRACP
jgi:hypothetical protein